MSQWILVGQCQSQGAYMMEGLGGQLPGCDHGVKKLNTLHVLLCFVLLCFVLLCFIKPILGNRYVRSRGFIVSEPREMHPRSEIADVPTLPCPPLDNLGCPDPPSTLTTSLATLVPSSSSSNGPSTVTTTLTTRGLCPGGSVVWAGPKFVRPHW